MGKIISVINRKGGVGKTTLAVGLSEAFVSEHSSPVIVVDLDPQASASRLIHAADDGKIEAIIKNRKTIEEVLSSGVEMNWSEIEQFIDGMNHNIRNRASVARALLANSDSFWDYELAEVRAGTEQEFKKRISSLLRILAQRYEYVIVDCSPGQSPSTEAAIIASDLILCPVAPERMALWGMELLRTYIHHIDADVPVRFVVTKKTSNNLANRIFGEIKTSREMLDVPGNSITATLEMTQSSRVQQRIEVVADNRSLSQLWGGTAANELTAITIAIQGELNK